MRLHDSSRFDTIRESLGNEANKKYTGQKRYQAAAMEWRARYENTSRSGIFKLATEPDKLGYIYIPADGRSADTIMSLVRHRLKNIHIYKRPTSGGI